MQTRDLIRVLIVDDEPVACRKIQRMLKEHPELNVIREVYSGEDAVRAIEEDAPDLVFLDIQMPDRDGFSVLDSVNPIRMPVVIFVTAFDEYALQAFECAAVDYLLKPFSSLRFEKALTRAVSRFREGERTEVQKTLQMILQPLAPIDRIMIREEDRIHFLPVLQIDWIAAEGRYVHLYSAHETFLLRQSISSLEARLDPNQFLRINRKNLVNVQRICELQILFHGNYRVLLTNGTALTLSRRYFPAIRQRLGLYATPAEKKRKR